MPNYNPLYPSEIASSQTVQAYHLNDNFNAIKACTDTKLSTDTSSPQTVAGKVTFSLGVDINGTVGGNAAFTNIGLGGQSLATVTNINTITNAGFYVTTTTATGLPVQGEAYSLAHYAGDATTVAVQVLRGLASGNLYQRVETAGVWGAWSSTPSMGSEIRGTAPVFATTTTIAMGVTQCMDSLRSTYINAASATLNLGTTGLNGLDTGTIASNTMYHVYAILNPTTGVSGYLASTSATSPTLPSGFTVFRRLPFSPRTKISAAQIMAFYIYQWGLFPTFIYTDAALPYNGFTNGTTNDVMMVLNAGTATSYTDVSCASFIPNYARLGKLKVFLGYATFGTGVYAIRNGAATLATTEGDVYLSYAGGGDNGKLHDVHLSASGVWSYRLVYVLAIMSAFVYGYTTTEVVG